MNNQWRRNEFESGGTDPAQSAEKFFWSCPFTFFGSKGTISRFVERFRDGQYSLVSFLFAVLLLTVPLCPAILKSGRHVPYGVGATVNNHILTSSLQSQQNQEIVLSILAVTGSC